MIEPPNIRLMPRTPPGLYKPLRCLAYLLCLLLTPSLGAADTGPSSSPAEPSLSSESITPVRPQVRLTTTFGDIDLELFPSKAPATVSNFLALIDEGFYNGLIFHRVIANFMIQVGAYDQKFTYREGPQNVVNESYNGLRNDRGTIAMARAGHPDSANAQFFINMKDNEHLNALANRPGYSVFGRVIAGFKNAERIELVDTAIAHGMPAVPVTPIEIIKAVRLPKPGTRR